MHTDQPSQLASSTESSSAVAPSDLAEALAQSVRLGVPGVSAAIATSKGVLWTGVAGLADAKQCAPIDGPHLFGVGSITKSFVAVVVLQLIEEGRLSLETKLEEILDRAVVAGIANATTATAGQLLAHTAGVPSWEDDPTWIRQGRGRDLDPARLWSKAEPLEYVRGSGHPAVSAPGQHFHYSNTGYTLLGLIIEAVTDATAEDQIRRRVLAPLQLFDTYVEGFEPLPTDRLPRRYHYATPVFRETAGICPAFAEVDGMLIDVTSSNLSVEWTAGGLVSSPSDLATFAVALRDGRLLAAESLALMQHWIPARPTMQGGAGLFRMTTPSGYMVGHNGSVLGFTGSVSWAEEGDAAIAVLCNAGSMHAGRTPPTARDIAVESEFTALALEFARQHG